MTRLVAAACIALTLFVPAALAQDYTFEEGSTQTISVNNGNPLPGWDLTWISSKDGVVATGSSCSMSSLSVGLHKLSLRAIWTATGYTTTPSVDILITAKEGSSPPPPPGPTVRSAHEDEEVAEVLLGCNDTYIVEEVYKGIVANAADRAKIYIFCNAENVAYDLQDLFGSAGIDDSSVSYLITSLDSVWMRDYGPQPVWKADGSMRIVDIEYYPNRQRDDRFPLVYANWKGLDHYPLAVSWEGGNISHDGRGILAVTDKIWTANSGYSQSQLRSMIAGAFGSQMLIMRRMYNEGTGHIDMFGRFIGPDKVVCGSFASGYGNYALLNENASRYTQSGYSVQRLAMANTGIKTYTNSLPVNGVMLVPQYNSSKDAPAMSTFRSNGFDARGVDCRRIIQYAGAIHCITISIPR